MTELQGIHKHFQSLAYFLVLLVSKPNPMFCETLIRMVPILSWILTDLGLCSYSASISVLVPYFGTSNEDEMGQMIRALRTILWSLPFILCVIIEEIYWDVLSSEAFLRKYVASWVGLYYREQAWRPLRKMAYIPGGRWGDFHYTNGWGDTR